MAKTGKKARRAATARRRGRKPAEAPANAKADGGVQTIDLTTLSAPLHVVAKSFAIMALRLAPSRPKTIQDRALFLEALGLDSVEIAGLLKSTPRSIAELLRTARR